MIIKKLFLSLIILLLFTTSSIYPAEIVCDGCYYEGCCVSPGSQTKNVGDSWTQYAADNCYFDGALCVEKSSLTLKILVSGSWVNVSSTTPIKTASANPSGGVNIQTTQNCDATQTPRASWVLVVNTGASGTYNLYVQSNHGTAYFNITVNAVAERRRVELI